MRKLGWYGLAFLILISCYVLGSVIVDNEVIIPSLTSIFNYIKSIKRDTLLISVGNTLGKTMITYSLSIIISLTLAIIATKEKRRLMIKPWMSIMKTIPTIAILLILIIAIGNERTVYVLPSLVIIPILYENFLDQIINVDKKFREVAIVYHFDVKKKIKYLYYYPLLERFMLSLKQTFGLCLKVIVMAEVIAQVKHGIGVMMRRENLNIETSGVFAWTLILIIIIVFADYLLELSSKKLLKWKCDDGN